MGVILFIIRGCREEDTIYLKHCSWHLISIRQVIAAAIIMIVVVIIIFMIRLFVHVSIFTAVFIAQLLSSLCGLLQ